MTGRDRILMLAMCAAVFIVGVAGCVTVGNEALRELPLEWPSLGVTKAEVQARLGPPMLRVVSVAEGQQTETWGYEYARIETNPWLFVPVAGLIALLCCETVTTDIRSLTISFDARHQVVQFTRSESPLASVFGLQPARQTP